MESSEESTTTKMPFQMSPVVWLTATLVAGVSIVATASAYIYTRNEGLLLEKRVDLIGGRMEKVEESITRRLERIEDKIDKIIETRREK